MKFKTAYHLGDDEILATFNTDESLTQQSDRAESDINLIVKKYGITGQIPQITGLQPLYGDFSGISDYRSMLDRVQAANDAFMQIPAHIRAEFDNDPQRFVEFARDEKNIDKLREWKLANPKEIDNGERPNRQPDAGSGRQPHGPGDPGGTRLPERPGNDQLRGGPAAPPGSQPGAG